MPWARMNRVTFARSTYSGEGVHTTSSMGVHGTARE